ncbi:hypothetical protein PthstB1num2_20870 [Parageobacillus thermoglucosidasius]|nr:hypothetical protein PthstB1num2_20870 [Parageobacillus thermoglucosidasius]
MTGKWISGWDRLVAGEMLLVSFISPDKGAGSAGKAGIKGAKAAGIAADVSELASQAKNILNDNKIKSFLQTVYR